MSMGNVKSSYKPSEWALREQYYINEVGKLIIPSDINTSVIKDLESKIDAVYSEASMDYAFAKRKLEALERGRKAIEKELFLIIKGQNIQGLKTVDEVNGAIVVALKVVSAQDVMEGKSANPALISNAILTALSGPQAGTPVQQPATNILQAIRVAEERVIFLDQVIDIMKEKKGALISDLGALKMEQEINPGSHMPRV